MYSTNSTKFRIAMRQTPILHGKYKNTKRLLMTNALSSRILAFWRKKKGVFCFKFKHNIKSLCRPLLLRFFCWPHTKTPVDKMVIKLFGDSYRNSQTPIHTNSMNFDCVDVFSFFFFLLLMSLFKSLFQNSVHSFSESGVWYCRTIYIFLEIVLLHLRCILRHEVELCIWDFFFFLAN